MTRKILALLFVAASFCAAHADDEFSPAKSFADFRRNLLQDYSSFRDGILKDYDKFLEQAWVEYDKHRGENRYSSPKPVKAPVISAKSEPTNRMQVLRVPVPEEVPAAPAAPEAAEVAESYGPQPAIDVPEIETPATFTFDFFGLPVEIADLNILLTGTLKAPKDYGAFWRNVNSDANFRALVGELVRISRDLQLNDYLTYELVSTYVNQHFSDSHSSTRTALIHYILANMGYGVRVAATDNGEGLLLVPFDRMVYARPYLDIDGKQYHVYCSDGSIPDGSTRIMTCPLPGGADVGASVGLDIKPLNIPVKSKPFTITYGNIELTGEVNENLFPIIYRYPQMDIGEYAGAILDPDLRQNLVEQLKAQLAEKPQLDAVNELLQFTQSAFDYATDDEAHGFEKPYFLEEILFYPQCDCEDRVIFYSYMLWNVLGVENQMITYPCHESAAVRINEEIAGDSYDYKGNTFYISDPTYIGAVTGQCMPDFRSVKAKLEYHYNK